MGTSGAVGDTFHVEEAVQQVRKWIPPPPEKPDKRNSLCDRSLSVPWRRFARCPARV